MSDFEKAVALMGYVPEQFKLDTDCTYWWMEVEDQNHNVGKMKVFGLKTKISEPPTDYDTPVTFIELVFPEYMLDKLYEERLESQIKNHFKVLRKLRREVYT